MIVLGMVYKCTLTDRIGWETMGEDRLFHRCPRNEIELDTDIELQDGNIHLDSEELHSYKDDKNKMKQVKKYTGVYCYL